MHLIVYDRIKIMVTWVLIYICKEWDNIDIIFALPNVITLLLRNNNVLFGTTIMNQINKLTIFV